MSRNNSSTSRTVDLIREQLAAAQASDATVTEAPSNQIASALAVTKDGRTIQPGEQIPLDANGNPVPTTLIPEATFHVGST